jgi:amino acid transporter
MGWVMQELEVNENNWNKHCTRLTELIGMTWGWIVAMIGIQSVAMSMAELCSSMPTSVSRPAV